MVPSRESEGEVIGSAETIAYGRRPASSAKELDIRSRRASRGPRGRHVETADQRKHGTTRGSPRRCSLAHSEGSAYKPPCGEVALCLRVGRMGSVSADGPGHYNLDRSEGLWGKAAIAACTVVHQRTAYPGSEPGYHVTGSEVHEGRMQTARREELAINRKARLRYRP